MSSSALRCKTRGSCHSSYIDFPPGCRSLKGAQKTFPSASLHEKIKHADFLKSVLSLSPTNLESFDTCDQCLGMGFWVPGATAAAAGATAAAGGRGERGPPRWSRCLRRRRGSGTTWSSPKAGTKEAVQPRHCGASSTGKPSACSISPQPGQQKSKRDLIIPRTCPMEVIHGGCVEKNFFLQPLVDVFRHVAPFGPPRRIIAIAFIIHTATVVWYTHTPPRGRKKGTERACPDYRGTVPLVGVSVLCIAPLKVSAHTLEERQTQRVGPPAPSSCVFFSFFKTFFFRQSRYDSRGGAPVYFVMQSTHPSHLLCSLSLSLWRSITQPKEMPLLRAWRYLYTSTYQ